MMVLKTKHTVNLYKVIRSVVIGDAFTENRKKGYYMTLASASWTHEQASSSNLHSKGIVSNIEYCKLNLCKFCIMGRQSRVNFTTSVHKAKSLLNLIHTDV